MIKEQALKMCDDFRCAVSQSPDDCIFTGNAKYDRPAEEIEPQHGHRRFQPGRIARATLSVEIQFPLTP
jgi:hypothetical protein